MIDMSCGMGPTYVCGVHKIGNGPQRVYGPTSNIDTAINLRGKPAPRPRPPQPPRSHGARQVASPAQAKPGTMRGMADEQYRAEFGAEVTFLNGGGLHAEGFREGVAGAQGTEEQAGALFVASLS